MNQEWFGIMRSILTALIFACVELTALYVLWRLYSIGKIKRGTEKQKENIK